MIAKFLSAILITVATSSAHAEHILGTPENPQLVQANTATLLKILNGKIVTLDRDLVTFHYETQNWNPTRVSQIQDQILSWPEHFYDATTEDNDMEGRGIYVAMDATSTRSYGKQDPQLYVITLRKGGVLLDGDKQLTGDEKNSIKQILSDMKCSDWASDDRRDMSGYVMQFYESKNVDCRLVYINAYAQMKVQGIFYGYEENFLPNCRAHRYAVSITDKNLIKADELAFYSNNSKVEGSTPLAGYVHELYLEGSKDYEFFKSTNDHKETDIPKTLANAPVPANFQQWEQSKIFGCGQGRPVENRAQFQTDLDTIFHTAFADSQTQNLVIQLNRAFNKRWDPNSANSHYFDLPHIRSLDQEVFQSLHLAPDKYEDYVHARDKLFYVDPSAAVHSIRLVAERLGEALNLSESDNIEDMLNQAAANLTTKDLRNPALLYILYRKIGLGPLTSQLLVTQQLLKLGEAPMFGEFATDLNKSYTNEITANQVHMRGLLQKCLDVYNSTASNDEVWSGPCGMVDMVWDN